MKEKVTSDSAKNLFMKLADIEIMHQERLLELYSKVTGQKIGIEDFKQKIVKPAMEGGLSSAEYIQMYQPDLESEIDILSLAMSIEAQALDLYQRAAHQSGSGDSGKILQQIADEERAHMAQLGKYIDQN